MSGRRIIGTAWLAGSSVVALGFLISCSSIPQTVVVPPEMAGATFVGNSTCYDCHTNIVRVFSSTPHARVHVDSARMPGGTGCESCHGPGSRHVAVGGGRGQFIVNPGQDPTACFACHLQVQGQFNLPQHHPVLEGKMNCVQCHDPHGLDIMKPAGGLAMARVNETCGRCHEEQAKPVVYDHEALREGCTVCHEPHGSINRKMLVQPDMNLCLRCHAQVQGPGVRPGDLVIGTINHTALITRGTCWSAGCHTAIHGSNMSRHLQY